MDQSFDGRGYRSAGRRRGVGIVCRWPMHGIQCLDLGWRTHLTGHRVVVAPDAVVRQGQQGLGVVHPRRTKVRQRQVALARGPVLASVRRSLGVALTSLLAALVLLLVKRPAEAADELVTVHHADSVARRLRSVELLADAAGLADRAGAGTPVP